MTANCLNLTGDGDDVDVIHDVERVFDIKLSVREAEDIWTVGELYDLIADKRQSVDPDTTACLSQASFYRLRRAFVEMGIADTVKPTTPLGPAITLIGAKTSVRRTWKELGRRAHLRLPPLEVRWVPDKLSLWQNIVAWLGIISGAVAVTFALHDWLGMNVGWAILSNILVLPLSGTAVALFFHFCFGTVPRRLETVGDLTREAAGFSFQDLWQEKKGYGPSDLWFALTAILRQVSGHKGPVERETTFFVRQSHTT